MILSGKWVDLQVIAIIEIYNTHYRIDPTLIDTQKKEVAL
jgi:hypothetical protein